MKEEAKHIPSRVIYKRSYLMNAYIIHNKESGKSILIDSLSANNEDFLLEGVHDLSSVLITHAHSDHIGSSSKVSKHSMAKVYTSELERQHMLKGTSDTPLYSELPLINQTLSLLRSSLDINNLKQPVFEGDIEIVHDNDTILDGIKVLQSPGHTDGALTFITKERDCFIGDILRGGLFSVNYTSWPFVFKSKSQILASIDRIRGYCDWYYPGHGFPFSQKSLETFLNSL